MRAARQESQRTRLLWTLLSVCLIAGSAIGLFLLRGERGSKLEVDRKSKYSHIRIRREGNVRTLLFVRDSGKEVTESKVDLDSPHELQLPYSRTMFASYLFKPDPHRVLIVGLGGGAMVHFLAHYQPDLEVDVVEIDPVVVSLADDYFHVRSEGKVKILTTDGFRYLKDTKRSYDVIYMDAFLKPSADTDDSGVPQRLKTIAFYKSIQQKLRPEGLVVFNLNQHVDTENDIATIASAFPQTAVFRCPGVSNQVVVGSLNPQRSTLEELAARGERLDKQFQASFRFRDLVNDLRQ